MELYFLRHGIAADRDDLKYKDDSLRPLTAQGKQKMRKAAFGMRALGLTFDAILCSPYLRAKQTAEIVTLAFKLKNTKINFTNNLVPDAPLEKLLREIRADFPKSESILLVGHEPQLTGFVSYLLKSEHTIPIDLKKGGLCHLSLFEDAVLNWILTPSQLCLMA